ncbi:hypothetical protein [Pedobacter sp. NJ-S-72]
MTFSSHEPQKRLINLFLLAKNRMLEGNALILFSKPDLNDAPGLMVTVMNDISKFSWPSLTYSRATISLPFEKEIELHLFDIVKKLSMLFTAYKTKIHHPLINFDSTIQKSFCCVNKLPHDLPELPHLHELKIDVYNFPDEVSWMAYWNKDIVSFLNLDLTQAEDIFYKVEKLGNGAMIYQLTKELLSRENTSHMYLLGNVYRKLSKVGARNLMPNV